MQCATPNIVALPVTDYAPAVPEVGTIDLIVPEARFQVHADATLGRNDVEIMHTPGATRSLKARSELGSVSIRSEPMTCRQPAQATTSAERGVRPCPRAPRRRRPPPLRLATNAGVLTVPFRVLAIFQAAILVLVGSVLQAHAGVVGAHLGTNAPGWAVWAIVAFLCLNTAGNLAAPPPGERWVMGSITLVVAGLSFVIALRAP